MRKFNGRVLVCDSQEIRETTDIAAYEAVHA
jgi:hypothetical protein